MGCFRKEGFIKDGEIKILKGCGWFKEYYFYNIAFVFGMRVLIRLHLIVFYKVGVFIL